MNLYNTMYYQQIGLTRGLICIRYIPLYYKLHYQHMKCILVVLRFVFRLCPQTGAYLFDDVAPCIAALRSAGLLDKVLTCIIDIPLYYEFL